MEKIYDHLQETAEDKENVTHKAGKFDLEPNHPTGKKYQFNL